MKSEIMWHFQASLCDNKGLLCDKLCKLCDILGGNLTLFYQVSTKKNPLNVVVLYFSFSKSPECVKSTLKTNFITKMLQQSLHTSTHQSQELCCKCTLLALFSCPQLVLEGVQGA